MTLFVAFGAAAALYGMVDISDQSEVRVRNGVGLAGAVVDLETVPSIKVGVEARRWEIVAGYGPRLSLLQLGAGTESEVLHRAWGSATFRVRRSSISFYEDTSYGTETFTSLVPEPTIAPGSPQLQPIPTAEVSRYVSSRTGCSAKFSASRRWAFGVLFEVALAGGLDSSSRTAMPFQAGPHATIGADYAATRADSVSASFDASRTLFSSGQDDTVFQLTESWRHRFGRDTESTLGAGIGWAGARDSALDSIHWTAYPAATAAIARRFRPARVETRLSFQVSPVVDRLNGSVNEWFQETAATKWTPTRALSMDGQLSAVQGIQPSKAGRLAFVFGEVALSYRVSQLVAFRGGARGEWMSVAGNDGAPFLWVVFVGATIRAPRIRL
jgi:hypothetical protein